MKYFKIEDFDSPDLQGSGYNMDSIFLEMIDFARERSGIPFIVNSGYRTEEHNNEVGGSATSSHLYGYAADISCVNGHDRIMMIKGMIEAGFRRIGIAKSFIHVDNDNSKPDSIWLYS